MPHRGREYLYASALSLEPNHLFGFTDHRHAFSVMMNRGPVLSILSKNSCDFQAWAPKANDREVRRDTPVRESAVPKPEELAILQGQPRAMCGMAMNEVLAQHRIHLWRHKEMRKG
jgi:hypothetical protein